MTSSYLQALLPFPPELSMAHKLPQDINSIIKECAENQVTLSLWESVSYLLFKSQRFPDFLTIMKYISEFVITQKRFDDDQYKKLKIRLYNSLSIYYLIQATKQDNQEKSTPHFSEVVKNFNLSDKYDFDGLTFSLKACYSFYRGEMDQTLNYYKTSLDNEQSLINPLIGMAQVLFARRNYDESLQYFKKALRVKPDLPGHARLGMAYCFYYVGKYTLAEFTFKRILQLEAGNVEAMLGLAVLASSKQDFDGYFGWLQEAFKHNTSHPVTLYYLAEHYLFKKEYERVQKCLKRGLHALEQYPRFQFEDKMKEELYRNDYKELKSRLCYLQGFSMQIQDDYEQAFKYYNQAKSLNRNNILAIFAMSQIYLHSQHVNYSESYKFLEKILAHFVGQECFVAEIQKPLAYVYSKTLKNRKQVLSTYQAAIKYNDQDSEVFLEYGQQLEGLEAAKQYKMAEQILLNDATKPSFAFMPTTKPAIFPELYINMGVSYLQAGHLCAAQECFKKCRDLIETFDIPDLQESHSVPSNEDSNKQEVQLKKSMYKIVLAFNEGILLEEQCDYPAALERYQESIKLNPFMIDSYVRLAHLQYKLGYVQESITILEEARKQYDSLIAINKNLKPINSISMMHGYIAHQMHDDQTAKEQFKQNPDDCYSKLSLMAYDYATAGDRSKILDAGILKQALRSIAHAAQRMITYDPHNCQAAIILILVMAEAGKLKEALSLLEELQDHSQINPRIFSNLAILEMVIGGEENYQSSKLYFKKFMEKTNYMPDEHTEISQSLLHLQHKNFQEAANVIKKQILRSPGNIKHRFNLNVIYHQQCYEILNDPKQNCNLKLLNKSISYFRRLMKIYEYMSKSIGYQHREQQYPPQTRQTVRSNFMIIKEKSEDRHNYISGFQGSFEKLKRDAEEQEKLQKVRMDEREKERREQMQKLIRTNLPNKDQSADLEKSESLRKLQEQFTRNWQEEEERYKEVPKEQKKNRKKNKEQEDEIKFFNVSSESLQLSNEEAQQQQHEEPDAEAVQANREEQKNARSKIKQQVKKHKSSKVNFLSEEDEDEEPSYDFQADSQSQQSRAKKSHKRSEKKKRLVKKQQQDEADSIDDIFESQQQQQPEDPIKQESPPPQEEVPSRPPQPTPQLPPAPARVKNIDNVLDSDDDYELFSQ